MVVYYDTRNGVNLSGEVAFAAQVHPIHDHCTCKTGTGNAYARWVHFCDALVVLGFPVGNEHAGSHVSVSDVCQRGRICERILDRTAFFQGQSLVTSPGRLLLARLFLRL